MRRLVRWLVVLGVLAGAGSAVAVPVSGWWHRRNAPKYTTAAVSRGRVETVVNSTGTVKPARQVTVGAFVSGPIAEIFVDFNSEIKKDQLLARIDPRLLSAAAERDRATLGTQLAELKRVEAQLQQAKNNEDRARRLMAVNQEYLSGTEFDQYHFNRVTLEAQREVAVASIAQAQAALKNSVANLEYTEIRSPVDGIVIERKVEPGQTVAASFQTPELFIVAPDMDKHMHVYASVDEADIGLIRSAQQRRQGVKFTVDAYPSDLFPGTIYQVRNASATNQNVVTYPVVIEAANPDLKLMPGMTANISFQIDAKNDVLRVPAAALRFVPPAERVRSEDKQYVEETPSNSQQQAPQKSASDKAELARKRQQRIVWVQDGERLRAVEVTLGLIESQFAELVGGDLKDGDVLVTAVEAAK